MLKSLVLPYDYFNRLRLAATVTATVLIVLLPVFSAFSQDVQLSGTVSCSDCTSGLRGISVLVYPEGSEPSALLAFTFTDTDGKFNVLFSKPKQNPENSVRVQLRSVQFAETDTTILLPDKPSVQLQLEIEIYEELQKLEEVIVQARSPLFEVRGDTLFFFIENQRDSYDRNLNDLLNRLPGVAVDHDTGNIRYLGAIVSYLLLDGVDLTGNQYGDLGRLINPDEIEGVQLFTDYHQNRLIKGLQPGEIALNIELKDSLLIKPKITLSGGALSDKRPYGQVQPEILALKKRHKWVLSTGVLNTGDDFSAFGTSSIEEIVQGAQQYGGRNFLGNIHREADLSRSSYVKNRQAYINLNHLYSKDEQLRWRTSFEGDLQDGGMRRVLIEEFFDSTVELEERVSDSDYRFDHIKLQATTIVELDIGNDTRSETHLTGRIFDQNSKHMFAKPSVANGNEMGSRKQQRFEIKQELTHRTNEDNLYTARFKYKYLNADHHTDLTQTIPQISGVEYNGYQNLLEKFQHASIHLETSRPAFTNTRVSTFLNAEFRKEEIDLAGFTNPFIFSSLPDFDSGVQLVEYREAATGQSYSNQTGHIEWSFTPTLKFTQFRINDSNNSSNLLGEVESKLQFHPNPSTSLAVEMKRHHESPVAQIFLSFPILQSNQTVIQGSMQPDLIPTNRISANLSFFGTEINDPFILITGSLTHRERVLVVDQQIDPEYTYNQYRTEKRSGLTGVTMVSLSQDFQAVNLGYKSDLNLFYHKFLISQQEGELQQVQSWIFNPSLNLFYKPQPWLILEPGISWGLMVFQSSVLRTQKQQNGRLSANADVRFRQFQWITKYQQIRPDLRQTSYIRLLGTELRYRASRSSLEMRFIFNNLLNQNFFDRNRLSDLGTISNRLELAPPRALVELSWNF